MVAKNLSGARPATPWLRPARSRAPRSASRDKRGLGFCPGMAMCLGLWAAIVSGAEEQLLCFWVLLLRRKPTRGGCGSDRRGPGHGVSSTAWFSAHVLSYYLAEWLALWCNYDIRLAWLLVFSCLAHGFSKWTETWRCPARGKSYSYIRCSNLYQN
jgi:hypothetical protein